MLWRLVESFNDNLTLLLLMAIGLAFAAGGLPPMLERRRRRSSKGPFLVSSKRSATAWARVLVCKK